MSDELTKCQKAGEDQQKSTEKLLFKILIKYKKDIVKKIFECY